MDSTPGSSTPPSDLFIVLEPFRAGFADFVRALEPLSNAAGDGPLLGSSDVYYRADTDIALLTIRLDRQAITPQKLAWLTSVAARADLPVLDPSRLGYSDRRAFYEDYLPNYRVRVEARGGPQEALEELARLLALPDAPPLRPSSSPSARPAVAAEDSSRKTVQAGAGARASGTAPSGAYGAARSVGKEPSARPPSRRTSGTQAKASPPEPLQSSPSATQGRHRAADSKSGPPAQRRRPGPALTSPEHSRVRPPEGEIVPTSSSADQRVNPRGAAVYPLARDAAGPAAPGSAAPSADPSKLIVPMPVSPRTTGIPVIGMPATDSDMPAGPRAAGPTPPPSAGGSPSSPPPSSARRTRPPALIVEDDDSPALQVRFLRGDHWAPGRLRALSLQGARLAAAAPPRLGDKVRIALDLDHLEVQLGGEVTQVTSAAQASGTGEPSGFSVHFSALEAGARTKLIALLKRAKQSGISLKPPPPRASVRFPVRWPTGVITAWGELNTAALDVSRSGLFLACGTVIAAREIIFHLPMDTNGRALSGRAQVAREVTEDMAQMRGLTRGYGVRILDFTRNDAERYEQFLDRIRQRTEKRVMIAARRERATDLGRGLISAGYAVHSGNDLVALAESMNEAGPPPDAALIEAGLLASEPHAAALKRALHSKQVPCLTIAEEQPDRARAVVDHLLQIT